MSEWKPCPEYKKDHERVVCAACRDDSGFIVTGARHGDTVMRAMIAALGRTRDDGREFFDVPNQGFINQWG